MSERSETVEPRTAGRAHASDAGMYWVLEGFTEGGSIAPLDRRHMRGLDPSLAGIKIVDCDTHFSEPPDLFKDAPAKYKDRMPVLKQVDGFDKWLIGDNNFGLPGGNVIAADGSKLMGRLAFPRLDMGDPGAYQVKPRLQRMDELGIYAQICYHNSGVTQAGSLMALGDDELALLIIRMSNDGCAQRQEESGQRLFSMAHLPLWNKDASLKEARRCIDMGLKGFVLPDKPERLGQPSWSNPFWDELWEMCEASGMPLNFHLNSSLDGDALAWDEFNFEQKLAVVGMMMSLANASNLANWMVSGVLDRFPKLKIGLIESGMGWVPFVVEMMEHQFDEMMPHHKTKLQKRPTEYFRDNFWCTFWYESIAPKRMLDLVGVDRVLFETDYPHNTSLYPNVQDHLVDVLADYDFATKKAILETNAVNLYRLPF
jgi:predicted TIM-barrel fold metal-dependent hydrolase